MRFTPCLAVLAIATAGCTDEYVRKPAPEPAATTTSGALTVDWTVRGTTDPQQCVSASAAAIEITVLDASNKSVGRFQQSCGAFATSISLDAGIYSASARMLDAAGAARTRAVNLESLTIHAQSQLLTPIDFPATAFF
jgi:hypothetical protein